jgi:uncharacterized membrane protein (DUF2068 family)
MNKRLQQRPRGITALIIFYAAGALISFVAGLSLLVPSVPLNGMWRLNPRGHEGLLRIGAWGVLLLFAASASCAASALGLWKRARWGYLLAMILIALNLLSDVINAVLGSEPRAIVGVPIALLIILYLLTKRVRNYFAESPAVGPNDHGRNDDA